MLWWFISQHFLECKLQNCKHIPMLLFKQNSLLGKKQSNTAHKMYLLSPQLLCLMGCKLQLVIVWFISQQHFFIKYPCSARILEECEPPDFSNLYCKNAIDFNFSAFWAQFVVFLAFGSPDNFSKGNAKLLYCQFSMQTPNKMVQNINIRGLY